MSMDLRVQGYENQVKLFLVLLVLFLVAVGVVSLNALGRTRTILLEETEARLVTATRAALRELEADPQALVSFESPGRASQAVAALREAARRHAIASLEIVDPRGHVVASTEPWRVGIVDPDAVTEREGAAAAERTEGAIVRERPALAGSDDEGDGALSETLVLLPLSSSRSKTLLKAGHQSVAMSVVARQIRLLSWTQAIAGLVTLLLALLFARWVLRPYRALKETAAQLQPSSPSPSAGRDDPDDLVASFRGVILKIKGQEAELERMRTASSQGSGALTQEMLDGLTSGVLILEADSRVKALNPAGEAILGRSRADLLGHPVQEIFAASPELLALLLDGVRLGRAHAREVVACARPSLPPAHLGVTVSALPSANGGTGGAFCIFSDLTEIRGLQERVRLKENLAGLGEMSAGIAHEFRNALATILGYARLLAREAGPAAEHGAAIAREVEGVGRIVDEFLRYARPARLQLSSWDPRAVIEDVAREAQRDAGRASVRIEVDGAWPPIIQADEALLRQAIQNLLKNALEATPEGGTVRVTGAHDPARGLVRVQVQDAGSGFPPEVLQRLFTPFVTTKPRGTGLGLAMAQKAVICHDGAIDVVNGERGGACVTVMLPLVAAASRPLAETAAHG